MTCNWCSLVAVKVTPRSIVFRVAMRPKGSEISNYYFIFDLFSKFFLSDDPTLKE